MIKIIDGDLLTSGADIICHQVNCQGKMNSGVAKQIREKYPEVFRVYKNFVNDVTQLCGSYELLGLCCCVPINNPKGDFVNYVANLFGQYSYGYDGNQYTDINALRESLLVLKDFIPTVAEIKGTSNSEVKIAFPWMMSCCRGGADWNEVYAMIDDIFKDYNIEFWRLDKE